MEKGICFLYIIFIYYIYITCFSLFTIYCIVHFVDSCPLTRQLIVLGKFLRVILMGHGYRGKRYLVRQETCGLENLRYVLFLFRSDFIPLEPHIHLFLPIHFCLCFFVQKKFSICPPDDRWARKNFEMRGAAVMKNNLNKARTVMNRPSWINEDIWPNLCNHWASQGYIKKRIQAKANRASDCGGLGGSLHTCGSITASQHKDNMVVTFLLLYSNMNIILKHFNNCIMVFFHGVAMSFIVLSGCYIARGLIITVML